MAKRKTASLKGRGSDIFFPDRAAPADGGDQPAQDTDRPTNSQLASQLASTPLTDDAELMAATLSRISATGRINAAFRFSQAELDELEDLVVDLRRQTGVVLHKKDVVRLGLALLFADNQIHEDSVLRAYAARKKESL